MANSIPGCYVICGYCNRPLTDDHGPAGACMADHTYVDLNLLKELGGPVVSWDDSELTPVHPRSKDVS